MRPEYRAWCSVTQARIGHRDEQLVPDVQFALRQLREASDLATDLLPDGRRGTLEDLQRKAELAAESVHDPAIVDALLQALSAFLGEELNEVLRNEPMPGDAMQPGAGEQPNEEAPLSDAPPAQDAAAVKDGEQPPRDEQAQQGAQPQQGQRPERGEQPQGEQQPGQRGEMPPQGNAPDQQAAGAPEQKVAPGQDEQRPNAQRQDAQPQGQRPEGGEKPMNPFAKDKNDPATAPPMAAGPAERTEPPPFGGGQEPAGKPEDKFRKPLTETRSMACEACGHQMEMMPLMASESEHNPATADTAAPQEALMQEQEQNTPAGGADAAATDQPADTSATLTEAARPAPPAGSKTVSMSEAERMEYVALKAEKRAQQEAAARREKATAYLTKVKESSDTYLTEDDLVQFAESQWGTLVKTAAQPPRYFGTGASTLGPGLNASTMRESANVSHADYFDGLYTGREH